MTEFVTLLIKKPPNIGILVSKIIEYMVAPNMGSLSGHSALSTLAIDKNKVEPLYLQTYIQLRDLILAGRIPIGARLPSTRDLAEDLEVSRKTVLSAYDQLIAEGYLLSRRGAGTELSAESEP